MIRSYVHKIMIHEATIYEIDAQISLQPIQKSGVSSCKSRIRDQVSWYPPPFDYCKINFDGSKLPNGQASFGFVIRDPQGKVLLCDAGALDSSISILVAEAKGLREDEGEDLKQFEDVQIRHAFREANAAADWMAHRGHTTTNTTYWFDAPDFPFAVIIRKDALGWPNSWDPS
ncbi:uncharacterized protein LOC130590893 [Beta vulgaris subsp. vulgaris]|uniref:uncharacterized protein LOC130590893 n=1 Tax=Beta vulgaris subsp. vulgaris TaxID=3555 RepID=UPI0025475E7A|nr:uncharacterized protein LOC130590893 [Beta vulgaris subsp. vulgaris]